jgi:hypothetical protein
MRFKSLGIAAAAIGFSLISTPSKAAPPGYCFQSYAVFETLGFKTSFDEAITPLYAKCKVGDAILIVAPNRNPFIPAFMFCDYGKTITVSGAMITCVLSEKKEER